MTSPYNSQAIPQQPEAKLERAKKCVTEFMKDSEEYTRPYFEEFSKIYSDYILARGSRQLYQKADLKLPHVFTIVESFTPDLVDAFFSDKPYINCLAKSPDFYLFEKSVEDFVTYTLDSIKIIPKFTEYCKGFLLFGTGIVGTPWRKESKLERKNGTLQARKTKDAPDWENIPIWDFFPDAKRRSPADIDIMRGCVRRVWKSYEELKAHQKKTTKQGLSYGVYSNLDEVKSFIDSDKGNNSSSNTDTNYQDKYTDKNPNIRRKGLLEVLEYWGEFDPQGDGAMQEYVITLVERKHVIRCDVNPLEGQYRPFLAAVDYPVPNEFYGMGEIKPAWSLIRESASLRNARLDAVNMTLNPMMVVDRTAGFNVKNLYMRPQGLILGNDINGIREFGFSDRALSSLSTVADLDQGITKAVGLTPSGVEGNINSNFSRTTSGVQYLNKSVNSRLALKVRLIAHTLFAPYARRILMQTKQFAPFDQFFRMTGIDENPFQFIPSEALEHDYTFALTSAMDRMTKRDRQANLKENIIPMLQLYAQMAPGKFDWNKFVPDTLRDFDYRQVNQYIIPDEVVQQQQQQQMQQQMAMAQANAQSQADSQAQLIALKEQLNAQTRANSDQMSLTRDIVKGVMDADKAEAEQDSDLTGKVSTTLLKEVTTDAREFSRPKPTSN